MARLRVDVYSPDGVAVGPGPVTSVLAAQYELGLNVLGNFQLDLPAEDARSSIIGQGYELRIHREGEGLVFRGIVDKLDTPIQDGGQVLRVTGSSIGRKLVWANTLTGLTYQNTPPSAALDSLLAIAQSQSAAGFTAGVVDAALTVLEASRMDAISVWGGIVRVADSFGMLAREDPINARVDMGAFGENPRGLRFVAVPQVRPELSLAENVFAIADMAEVASSEEVWTRVVVYGSDQGIAGSVPAMNLRYCTRTGPYPITSFTGPGGDTQYAMNDYSAQVTHGVRTKPLYLKDAQPLGLSALDFAGAANTMYDRAATWLSRHNQPQKTYAVRTVGLRHLASDGTAIIRPGNKVRVQYRGEIVDRDGQRLWKSIDQSLYVMSMRRTMAGATDVWDLVVSDVPRQVEDDGNLAVALLEQVTTLQSVPSPFIMLASAALRVDKYGLQARRLSGQYPHDAVIGNYGMIPPPAGNEDMDFNADGVINILDLSYMVGNAWPPRRSGTTIWHSENDFVDGAIPGSMFNGTPGDMFFGTPSIQAYIQGLAAKVPNGNATDAIETSHGAQGDWGAAGFGAHEYKSAAASQADVQLRARDRAGSLIAGLEIKAASNNTALVRLLGALAQGATAKAQITSNQNDYDIGAKTGSAFSIYSDAARDITGILATSVADGTLLFVQNVGSYTITLKDESASSSAANRFALTADFGLAADAGCILQYNAASSRWRLLTPGGAGMNKVTGSGYLVMPAAAGGIDPANSGVAWTSGAWSQVVASTSEDDSIIGYMAATALGIFWEGEIDIGTGGAGSEVVVATIPVENLYTSNVGYNTVLPAFLPAPIEIPTGTRVAVRVRSSSTTGRPADIKLVYVKKTELVAR